MATGRYDALQARAWGGVPELERWRREGVADELTALETYRSHSIVHHENTWYGISNGYRGLLKSRIERRSYRRLVVAASREDMKRALDRMPYPELLMHAGIAVNCVRAPVRYVYRAVRSFGLRLLLAFGWQAQRAAGRMSRLMARVLQR
jgi:hypothetical protein